MNKPEAIKIIEGMEKGELTLEQAEALRTILADVKDADKGKLLEFAVQQFTGFHEAVRGRNDVIDLVNSMGLTKAEFKQIRKDLGFMHHDELAELDHHFTTLRDGGGK